MAGSMKWVRYVADNGVTYSVRMDESNSIAGGFADQKSGESTNELPKGTVMRYVNVLHGASGTRRRLYLGTPANALKNGGLVKLVVYSGTTATVQDFQVTSYRGEKKRAVFAADTALNDGTAE